MWKISQQVMLTKLDKLNTLFFKMYIKCDNEKIVFEQLSLTAIDRYLIILNIYIRFSTVFD